MHLDEEIDTKIILLLNNVYKTMEGQKKTVKDFAEYLKTSEDEALSILTDVHSISLKEVAKFETWLQTQFIKIVK
jgi:hypothetical protein